MDKKITQFIILIPVLFSILMLASYCGSEGKVRKYTEKKQVVKIVNRNLSAEHGSNELKQSSFTWQVPKGWTSIASSSSLRIATFEIGAGQEKSVCTIIPLKGEAGGLKANVVRWLRQLNIEITPESERLQKFIKSAEQFLSKGKYKGFIFDFTSWVQDAKAPSFLITVIEFQQSTVFIKMMGEKAHLQENLRKFRELSKSFIEKENGTKHE